MKKILIYVDSMAPAGGIERVISNLSNEWSRKYEIVLLTKDNNKSFYYLNENITMRSLNIPLILNMKSRLSRVINIIKNIFLSHNLLKKYIKEENPDYIYTANPFNSLEIFILGKKYRKKLVISEHGSKFGYNKVYNVIKKIVYPRSYKVSVPTITDTKLYLEEKNPAVYIPHICTFKAEKKNDLDKKIVLNIGRLTSDKQQINLLRIWKKLDEQGKIDGWKLRIVGKGELLSELENYITDNKINDIVEIVKPTKNIKAVFEEASIFAFTSKFEGFGMVLLEAMSFGIPCISFDCPSGPRDIIKNGENGYLIKDRDLESFGKKLSILMSNSEIRYKMGKEAFNTVKGWNNRLILSKWDELFK